MCLLPFCDLDALSPLAHRHTTTPEEALVLVLIRLSIPRRLVDLSRLLRRSAIWLSAIYNTTVLHLWRRWSRRLAWNPALLERRRLLRYARHVESAGGGPLYWGFVDGTARRTCRPGRQQAVAHNGHKKVHCFRFSCVVTPDKVSLPPRRRG